MRKRILGMLLSAAMVVGLINVPAIAATEDAAPDYLIQHLTTSISDVDEEIDIPTQ